MAGIDEYTKMCLHFDNNLTDSSSSGHTVDSTSNVSYSTDKYFGTYAISFAGNGYARFPAHADFNFGSGNFTIDYWVKTSDASGIIASNHPSGVYNGWWISEAGGFICYGPSGEKVCPGMSGNGANDGTWNHIAIIRDGNTIWNYLNGTRINNCDVTGDTIGDSSTYLYFADNPEFSRSLTGLIDEFRISKGIARWTGSSFTVPTAPYSSDVISGNLSSDARVIIINESDWSLESNTTETAGSYEISVSDGQKLVVARKSDGELLAYGSVAPST